MHPDRVFIAKVADLRSRVDHATAWSKADPEYEIFMAAPLLRELLMGHPTPQVHIVNRSRRLKLQFTIQRKGDFRQQALDPMIAFNGLGVEIHPPSFPGLPGSTIVSLNLDQFLAEPVTVLDTQTLSVRDIIDYVANAAGAVHFGDREKNKRAMADSLANSMWIGGMNVTLQTLLDIGRVTVDALDPLVRQIESEYAPQVRGKTP